MKKSYTYTIFLLILVAVLLAVFVAFAYRYAVYSPYRISSNEAKRRLEAGDIDVVLDVRTDMERSSLGFYPNSLHIQSADLERVVGKKFPNKNTRILVYCNTGHRARAATDKLHALGYNRTVYISSQYQSLL
jgi:rhodanese-related sulfurtransferase